MFFEIMNKYFKYSRKLTIYTLLKTEGQEEIL